MLLTVDDIYNELGVYQDKLGCIMLDTEPLGISDIINEEDLYYAKEKDRFWIDGIVSEKVCHVTLLYGLMQSGNDWKRYVDALLEGWKMSKVTIDHVDYFESPYADEEYYCIIAKLVVDPKLLDANGRLRKLPHIDSFPMFTPHITLAYIKRDPQLLAELLYALNNKFIDQEVKTIGINYGR